ncbi:MAG: class I SAM-dependent methyltransferase [Patescibacteria group bacterium]
MKNIIEEKPTDEKHGRAKYNCFFVDDNDIKEKTVLDIGCGFGWQEVDLLNRGVEKVVGIEVSEKDLVTARKYLQNEKVDFQVASATTLPFEKNRFETVISWEVLEHIPKDTESKMFEEVNRVLKSGGVFYLSTPNRSFFSNIFDPAWWLIGHRHYSVEQIVKLAQESNFLVERIVVNGGWWEIVGINNLYIAKWLFRRRPFFEKFVNQKQDTEYKKQKGFTGLFVKLRKNE